MTISALPWYIHSQNEGVCEQSTVNQPNQQLRRTDWAERHVEEFLSLPLISEFVFRSPQTLHGTQREVADLLVAHGDIGVLVSQKCQEDPASRDAARTESWARKEAKKAVTQLCGALRTATGKPVWCDHPRRGRVEFPDGLPKIDHGIVVIEVFQAVDLEPDAAILPLEYQGTPVSYLSVNDFLNLTVELRTTRELLEYLQARRSLPAADLRIIGDEKSLFEFYLLSGGSLRGLTSRAESVSDRYSNLLEHVADQLATRNPDYPEGIPAAELAKFEPASARVTYLEMQGVLVNLRLPERGELGRAFHGVIDRLAAQDEGFFYMAVHLDSKPEWVFVFGSSKKLDRAVLLDRMGLLMHAAMAFFEKSRCLTIIDRDGLGYDAGYGLMRSPPTQEERRAGDQLFGRLRIVDRAVSLSAHVQ
jgi:hypothetical protein